VPKNAKWEKKIKWGEKKRAKNGSKRG